MFDAPALVPELDVADVDRSLAVYLGVFGFTCHAGRPAERFACLIREDARLMLEEASGPGGRFGTAPLDPPFGRGMNPQIRVTDVDALYAAVQQSGLCLVIPMEDRWYRQNRIELGNRQFVAADPDGDLLRFFGDLGARPVESDAP